MTVAVHRFTHQAMGTNFEIFIAEADGSYAGQAARAVFCEVDRVERLFSRFDPASEISRISRLGPGQSMAIGLETYECLKLAEEIRAETNGAFDINCGDLTESTDVPRNLSLVPADGSSTLFPSRPQENEAGGPGVEHPESPSLVSGLAGEVRPGLELAAFPGGFMVRIPEEAQGATGRAGLDLGAVGKGFALDRGCALLADWDIGHALLHGGTSTALALGAPPSEDGWPVGVGGGWPSTDPDIPDRVFLKARALSGSGTEVKGRHILNPRRGRPAEEHLAAWASHPSAAISDALSTAFMVMTTDEVEDYCRRHPETWALVVRGYGDCRVFNNHIFMK